MWLIPIRPDINFAVKELSRSLQHPTIEDKAKLKYVLRYIKGTKHYGLEIAPRITQHSDAPLDIVCFVDSDWGGCRQTRKSTGGCVVQVLGCTVHHYSRVQQTLATSSGEAELYAIGSSVGESLGILNFVTEARLCTKASLRVHTGSTSAKAMATRIGTSKLTKHILRHLYVQDLVQAGMLRIIKIDTRHNIADILTKHVLFAILQHHNHNIGLITTCFDTGDQGSHSTTRSIFATRARTTFAPS